jgi:hypothetical protein
MRRATTSLETARKTIVIMPISGKTIQSRRESLLPASSLEEAPLEFSDAAVILA